MSWLYELAQLWVAFLPDVINALNFASFDEIQGERIVREGLK